MSLATQASATSSSAIAPQRHRPFRSHNSQRALASPRVHILTRPLPTTIFTFISTPSSMDTRSNPSALPCLPSPPSSSSSSPSTSSFPSTPRRNLLLLLLSSTTGTPLLALFPQPPPAAAAAAATLPTKPPPATPDPGDWSSPGLGAPVDPSQPRFVKLPSGVRFQELNVGSGPAAGPGDTVLFDYVLRRSNGYFIYGTVEGVSFQPSDVPTAPVAGKLGTGELIPGLEEVLYGMAPGSKRRALVPPELGYVSGVELPQPPTFATKRQLENHRREPLLFEVQMLRVGGRKQ